MKEKEKKCVNGQALLDGQEELLNLIISCDMKASFLGPQPKELGNRICGFRVLRLLKRFARMSLGHEHDERGSLGFNFDRRRWRGEGDTKTAAVERRRRSALCRARRLSGTAKGGDR